jgi:hypothetical protein
MGTELEVNATRGADGPMLQIWVREPELVGKSARLKIELVAKVKRSSPVHGQRVLLDRDLTLASGLNLVRLGKELDGLYCYSGGKLDLEIKSTLKVDDGVFFDSSIETDLSSLCELPPRAAVGADHKRVHSPADRFNFIANLRAIPAAARIKVLWMLLVGLPLIVGNALLGTRDQFVPESQTWFYDHSDSDGEGESPLVKALMGSGGLGLALWAAIRRQLQQYMRFGARLPKDPLRRDLRCRVADMVEGETRVLLQHATLRIVAYNREHGQYTAKEKNGKQTRTVTRSFTENARGIVLHEQALAFVPANAPLAEHVEGEIDFAPMFDALYPPFRVQASHGLSLMLEAQLIHPDYVDHDIELEVNDGHVRPEDFYGRA